MNGTGKGGKNFQDRELAAKVRTLALNELKEILEDKNYQIYSKDLHNQVILKLAGTVLPRLNEVTGKDGEDLFPKPIMELSNVQQNDSNNQDNADVQEDSGDSRWDEREQNS